MKNHFRPQSEKSAGELLIEKMLGNTRAAIRKGEDEAIVLKERMIGLHLQRSDLEYLLETVIEDSIEPEDEAA